MKICSVCQRYYEDSVEVCAENHGPLIAPRAAETEMIGNYRLGDLLERDAGGETYLATHTASDQPFVVKIFASKAAGSAEIQRERIQTEARAAVDIVHPNAIRVYDTGSLANGDFYVLMEAVGGQTLRERLRDVGTLSESEAVTVARQTADALAAAHAVGVIHRAVSPANIVLNADGENRLSVKLQNFDFGAVNQRTAVAEISAVHPPIDALRYLSPEQCAGGEAVDARADVYGLGVVLYEMLCGRSPFDAPTLPAIVEKQINEQPLSRLRYDVRALLMYLLKQSLQSNASARLPSAGNFARQLRQIEQLVAPPAGMRQASPQTSAPKKFVPDAAAFSVETPAPHANELPIENFQPQGITARDNADAVIPTAANQLFVPSAAEGIKENTIDENSFPGEPQPIFVEGETIGVESLAAEPILIRKKETSHASFESEPILVRKKQVDALPHESIPLAAAVPGESGAFFVKNEGDAAEVVTVESLGSSVAGVKMREARQPLPAPILNDTYVPSRARRLFAPSQFPMLVGATLFTLIAFAGLYMFWDSQREESAQYERKVAKETPIPAASQPPRAMPDVNNNALATTEFDEPETEEAAPIAVEESPSTASKRETQRQPRQETPADGGARQPNEAVKSQPAREEPVAEAAERAANEAVEEPVTGDEQTKLNSSLDQWITATNARDVEGQMNYYAPKLNAYYRTRNASPELVRAEKRRVFERANAVDIQTGKPEITLSRDGRSATMRFRKKYAIKEGQKSRSGEVIQELRWVKSGADWKIVSERDVKVVNR